MWNNIVIEVGKYRSWPNTYPFQDGYLGANIQPSGSDPSTLFSFLGNGFWLNRTFCLPLWNGTENLDGRDQLAPEIDMLIKNT